MHWIFYLRKSQKDQDGNELTIDRAKSFLQIGRNHALREAPDNLKKNPLHNKKKVEIIWKNANDRNKDREVQVDGITAFRQKIDDVKGSYVHPFEGAS